MIFYSTLTTFSIIILYFAFLHNNCDSHDSIYFFPSMYHLNKLKYEIIINKLNYKCG